MKIIKADPWYRDMKKEEVNEFLAKPLLMRIGLIDIDNYPMVHPVWFLYKNEEFIVLSHKDSKKVRILRDNPKVYFLIDTEKPTGVRGKGDAELLIDEDRAVKLMDEMLKKYGITNDEIREQLLEEAKKCMIIKIKPGFLATWIYK